VRDPQPPTMLMVLTQMRQTADCDLSLTQTFAKAEPEAGSSET
jgi:hypothetical protein